MRRLCAITLFPLAALLLGILDLHAQTSQAVPRITGPVNEASLTTLKGNISGRARPQFDQGEATSSTQLHAVRLVLTRSAGQEAALEKFMAEQLDKSSPNYHKWLTPEQFGKLYGPADSDIAVLVAWLQSHGLTVDNVSTGRTNIAFSGTVAQVEEALHITIHSFNDGEQQFYANTNEPRIPTALAPVVGGVAHLSNYQFHNHSVKSGMGSFDAEQKRLVPVGTQAHPQLTTGSSGSYFLYIVPGDAATIYDTPNSYNANFSSGTAYTGKGVTIGIGGDALIQASTVVNFRSRFLGGDTTAPTITNVGSSAVAGDDTNEAYLDTETSGGLAPGAAIHLYTAANLEDAIEQMLSDNSVDIFSLSFGECEMKLSAADNTTIASWWQQAAAQGIAVTVSTGDSGSAGCDDDTEQVAVDGLQVSGFSSTPYNIAVGGTDLYGLISNFSTYVGTSNSSSNSYRTVNSNIPESTWNDSATTDGLLSANVPYVDSSSQTNIVGGAGGASSCSSNTGSIPADCKGGYAKPSWQRGTGVPSDSARDVPDVSLMAGDGFDSAAWLVCTDDTGSVTGVGTVTANCSNQSNNRFYFRGYGGTSASAPAFAGILALVQQKVGSRLGADGAKTLYDLFNGSSASSVFHDITVGNNSVYCSSGTANCSKNTAGNLFLTGYNTTTGYDQATGLGSVDATQLVNAWGSATGSGTATVTIAPTPTSITTGQALSVAVTIGGSGSLGTPTGTVALSGGGYTSAVETLSAGAYTFSIPAGSLTIGSDTLTVTYSGDSNYASTSSTASVTVAGQTPTVTATPSASSITTDQSLQVAVAVSGSGVTPTGTVTLSGGAYIMSGQSLVSGAYTFVIPAGDLTVGTDNLVITYSGDSIYAAGSGSTTVTVTQGKYTPTVTVSLSASSITILQALTVSGMVTASSGTPTGTVTITGGGYTSSAQSLNSGAYSITIPAGSLSAGADTLTVSYSGDTNFKSATNTGSVTVTKIMPATTVTPAATSIDSAQALSVTVTVSGSGPTPTGTVNLSGGGYTGTQQTLASGAATFSIPANTLSSGSVTLTSTYSGDSVYASGSGSSSVTVTQSVYTLSASAPSAVNPGSSATSTVTVSTATGYSGSITLACAVTTSPSNAQDLPTCSVTSGSPVALSSSTTSGTATITVSTTASNTGSLDRRGLPGWLGASGGTALALLVFLGIPARNRSWRKLLGLVVLLAALGGMSACGGGSSSGGGGGGSTGTTAGSYTFTVTGTGNPAVSPAPTTTFTLTVN